jgi:predicted nuclease with TOPRIM domain
MEDINKLLDNYEPGLPQNKPDVTKQMIQIQETREKLIQDQLKQQNDYNNLMNKLTNVNPQMAQDKIDKLTFMVQELAMENNQLKEKVKYLEDKLKSLIMEQIQLKRNCTVQQN